MNNQRNDTIEKEETEKLRIGEEIRIGFYSCE